MGKTKFRTKTMPKTLFPKWNEKFSFTNVNIATPLTVHVKDEGRLGDEDLGMAEIDLRNQMTRANAAGPGCNWTGEDWVLFNDKVRGALLGLFFSVLASHMQQPQFPNSAIRLKFDFKFVPVAESQSLQRLEEAALKESSFLSFFKKKKKRQIRGELGVPEQAQYQLRLHLYQARQLVAADASGLSDPYVVRAFPFPPSLLRPGPRQAKPSCGADCAPVRQEGQERRQARDSQPGVVSDVPRQCGAAHSTVPRARHPALRVSRAMVPLFLAIPVPARARAHALFPATTLTSSRATTRWAACTWPCPKCSRCAAQ
jgi:hypothetical protein